MQKNKPVESVFNTIRVLDFGQWVAGPAAALMFADLGAEVIRIDPPGGPRWNSPAAEVLNRRKKSIVLDLKQSGDLDTARELVGTADILIENFRPGVMDRLGLGADASLKLNPALIYVSIPGFASEDEEYAGIRAWEAVIAAASGQFTDMGLNRILMGINPSFSPITIASAYASVQAAFAAASALYAREETGRGDYIEVPIASALNEGLVYNSMLVGDLPDRYKSLREREIERREHSGEAMNMRYEELQEYLDPFYRSFFCADGRPVYVVSSCHKKHAHKTLEVMGLLEEARDAGVPEMEDWYSNSSEWPEGVDCALGLYPTSKAWADWLSERMKAVFLQKTSFEWEKLFGECGVPVSAHRTTEEWLCSEHPKVSGLLQDAVSPKYGSIVQPGPFIWLESLAESAAQPCGAVPADNDRAEILSLLHENDPEFPGEKPVSNSEQQKTTDELPFRKQDDFWLKGLKVLDMTNVIAGPMTGENLLRFGAEVIKLDPVQSTYDPWNTVLMGLRIHCGKKSLLADINTDEGRELLQRLLKWGDVVIFNGPERQLEPLGLDTASLNRVNPEIILCRLDAWGGPFAGPHSDFLGYDDLVQASTGIMSRFGGSINTPEEHAHLGTIDVLTGFAASFSVAAALFQKRRSGKPDVARTSLCAMGQLLQIPFMYNHPGRAPFDEGSGRDCLGEGPFYRCYEASNGWFFLAAAAPGIESDMELLNRVEGLSGIRDCRPDEMERFLTDRFKYKTIAEWTKRFKHNDIAAVALGSLAELRERYGSSRPMDSHAGGGTFQFTKYENHPGNLHVEMAAACSIRPRFAQINVPPPAERFGKETRRVLASMGYSENEIQGLLDKKIVSEGWGSQYLPD